MAHYSRSNKTIDKKKPPFWGGFLLQQADGLRDNLQVIPYCSSLYILFCDGAKNTSYAHTPCV